MHSLGSKDVMDAMIQCVLTAACGSQYARRGRFAIGVTWRAHGHAACTGEVCFAHWMRVEQGACGMLHSSLTVLMPRSTSRMGSAVIILTGFAVTSAHSRCTARCAAWTQLFTAAPCWQPICNRVLQSFPRGLIRGSYRSGDCCCPCYLAKRSAPPTPLGFALQVLRIDLAEQMLCAPEDLNRVAHAGKMQNVALAVACSAVAGPCSGL